MTEMMSFTCTACDHFVVVFDADELTAGVEAKDACDAHEKERHERGAGFLLQPITLQEEIVLLRQHLALLQVDHEETKRKLKEAGFGNLDGLLEAFREFERTWIQGAGHPIPLTED